VSGFEQIAAVGDAQYLTDVLLDDQHGVTFGTHFPYHFEDGLHDDRREAGRRLIEQQQLGARHECAPNCAHLLLATR
jgi:hypothetical protein